MSRWLAIVAWWAALPVFADDAADRGMAAGVVEFTAAYQAWDAARFQAAATLFERVATNPPPSVAAHYWLGVSQFHRMLQLRQPPEGQAIAKAASDQAMNDAIEALQTAVKLDPRHAESHALLGTLYGMKIDGNLFRALRFGPRVAKHRDRALEFGAGNPRVRYLQGMCLFHTAEKPAAWREALAELLAADTLFATEAQQAPGPLEPRWGRSSCRTFIGRTYELLGQPGDAAEYYRRALAEHPADHLARQGLARISKPQ